VISALILAALVYVPIAPQELEFEPDLSFRATTHDAFARGLQIGVDIVSTYGPWGLLQRGYDHRTDAVVLTIAALLAAVFAWSTLRIGFDAGGGSALIAWIATSTAACIVAVGGFDARFTVVALLLVLSALLPPSLARELPLVAALGVIALIKMSLLALAVFVVIGTALARRRPVYVAVFTAFFLAAWFGAGQRVATFPHFLATGFEVARGYAGASAVGSGVPLAVIGAAGLAIVVVLVERSLLAKVLVLGPIAYLAKVGFVRGDRTHGSAGAALLLLFAMSYLLLRREAMPRVRRAVVAVAAIAAAVIIVAALPLLHDQVRSEWAWMHNRSERLAVYEHNQSTRAGAALVPPVAGTIDAYPWGSAALIARAMDYTPRPVFQSCMAWTPTLAQLNAAFLRGPRAPEWLWASVGSIDGRLPILDDAPSWLEMINRYDIASEGSEHLLLHKRAVPFGLTTTPLATLAAQLGGHIAVPDRGMVWCEIETRSSFAGVVRDLLGRPAMMTIETITASGQRKSWNASRAMLRAGFLISPQVIDVPGLTQLLSGRPGQRVTSIRVTGEGLQPSFIVRFRTIAIAAKRPVRA
jgi:hypothetical protein